MKRLFLIIVSLCSVVVSRAQCPEITGKNIFEKNQIIKSQNEPYSSQVDNKFQMLDLYIPPVQNCENVKLILMIHGGGFEGGNKSYLESWGYYFARKGYYAAAINYRLYMTSQNEIEEYLLNPFLFFGGVGNGVCDKLNSIDFESGFYKIDKAWYFAIQDSRAALAYLQHRFERQNKNLERVYAIGESAGAISALGLALGQQEDFNQFSPFIEEEYGSINDQVAYQSEKPKNIDAAVSISGGLINAEYFLSDVDTVPILFFHGGIDDVVPLCMDNCFYSERRTNGPLIMSEMSDSLGLSMNMEMHIWADLGHDVRSKYALISDHLMNWLNKLNNQQPLASGRYTYPERSPLYNCDLVVLNNQLRNIINRDNEANAATLPQVNIYPNPSRGKFSIKTDGNDEMPLKLDIYDVMGNPVLTKNYVVNLFDDDRYIDATSLDPGIYSVLIYSNSQIVEKLKLIIQ